MKKVVAVFLLISISCAGCRRLPPGADSVPEMGVPKEYSLEAEAEAGDRTATGWLEEIGNAQLSALVDEALRGNPDLQIMRGRLEQAEAEARIAGAELWPELNARGTASRRKINQIGGGIQVGSTTVTSYDPALATSWEIDLWGRHRDSRNAAAGNARAAYYDMESARLSLAAQVARAWFALAETRQQLALSRDRLNTFESNEQLIEKQYERGLTDALDYRLIRSQTRSARAAVEQEQAVLDAQIRQFEVLLGRYPERALEAGMKLPVFEAYIPAGLPSELLQNRPDILAAKRRFLATADQLKAAVKLQFPQISLTASAGSSSNELDNLASSGFRVWSLVGSVAQPLFQGGAIRGNIDRSEASLYQAAETYRNVVLKAFQEVETALNASQYLAEQRRHLKGVVEESRAAENLAWDRYQRGLVDVITVLEAQRRAFDAESGLLAVSNAQIQNRIDLYLALGGSPFYGAERGVGTATHSPIKPEQ